VIRIVGQDAILWRIGNPIGNAALGHTAGTFRETPPPFAACCHAVRECLAVRAERGMPPTVTTREVDVVV